MFKKNFLFAFLLTGFIAEAKETKVFTFPYDTNPFGVTTVLSDDSRYIFYSDFNAESPDRLYRLDLQTLTSTPISENYNSTSGAVTSRNGQITAYSTYNDYTNNVVSKNIEIWDANKNSYQSIGGHNDKSQPYFFALSPAGTTLVYNFYTIQNGFNVARPRLLNIATGVNAELDQAEARIKAVKFSEDESEVSLIIPSENLSTINLRTYNVTTHEMVRHIPITNVIVAGEEQELRFATCSTSASTDRVYCGLRIFDRTTVETTYYLTLVDFDSASMRVVSPCEQGYADIYNVRITKDGKKLLYSTTFNYGNTVWEQDLDSGLCNPLIFRNDIEREGSFINPRYSENGDKISFISNLPLAHQDPFHESAIFLWEKER